MKAPVACLLPGPAMDARLAAIADLARRTLLSHEWDGRTLRLRYASAAADALDPLVALERDCCAFLDFDLVRRPDAVHLVITAPPEGAEFASALTAHFLGEAQAKSKANACGPSCGCGAKA